MASSASSFALNSFYGGSKGTSSNGRDSALSNTEWPPLNSVTTKRKVGRPSVSQNKGKKGRSSVDKENVSLNNSVNMSQDSMNQNKGKKGRSNVDKENVSFNNSVNMSQDCMNTTKEILSLSLLDQANEDNLQVFNKNYYGDLYIE